MELLTYYIEHPISKKRLAFDILGLPTETCTELPWLPQVLAALDLSTLSKGKCARVFDEAGVLVGVFCFSEPAKIVPVGCRPDELSAFAAWRFSPR